MLWLLGLLGREPGSSLAVIKVILAVTRVITVISIGVSSIVQCSILRHTHTNHSKNTIAGTEERGRGAAVASAAAAQPAVTVIRG